MKKPMRSNGHARSISEQRTAIRIARRYSAPPERVFNAWLAPEVAGKWLFATALHPMTEVEIDARVGGSFRLAERRDGRTVEHCGRFIEIVPHRRLVFALVMADRPRAQTRVTVEISPLKTGCRLALRHEDLPLDHVIQAETRWTGSLYGLGVTDASMAVPANLNTRRSH